MTHLLVKYITLCLEIWVPIHFTLLLHSEKFQIWNQTEVWGSVYMVIIDESALTAAVNDRQPNKYKIQDTQNFLKCTRSISDKSDNFSTICRAVKETRAIQQAAKSEL
jgi:hypothetical protein